MLIVYMFRHRSAFLRESYIPKECKPVSRDRSVGIATRYGLDGPGIEFRRRRDFSHPSRPALGPT
jgi:hypothetical protein